MINRNELESLVLQFVDEQSGLLNDDGTENSGCSITNNYCIILWSKGSMCKEEWRDEAEELIELLEKEGFGTWEVGANGSTRRVELDLVR